MFVIFLCCNRYKLYRGAESFQPLKFGIPFSKRSDLGSLGELPIICARSLTATVLEEAVNLSEKTCSTCGETKALTEFSKGKAYRDGHRGQCKACVYAYEKSRQQKPEYKEKYRQWVAHREEERQRVVRQKKEAAAPKLSEEEFEAALQAHNYRCDICGVKHNIEGETKHFSLIQDHNYRTGVPRGLLCSTCYSAMCFFGDDLEGIMRVVEYLRRYEPTQA